MLEGLRCYLRPDTLFIPFYIYSFNKIFLKYSKDASVIKITIISILRVLLTLIESPIAFIVIFLLALYSDLVRMIAQVYFGERYVDFASGGDAMYSGDSRLGKGIIPAVYYIEKKDSRTVTALFEHLKKVSRQVQSNHPRLQCTQRRFFGYIFFLKAANIGLKYIRYFDDYNDDDEFQTILNKKISSALPLNNAFLWDVTLGRKSVNIQGRKCIPLLFRLHHSLGDGVTLMTLLLTNYADNGSENVRILCEDLKKLSVREPVVKKPIKMFTIFDDFMKSLYTFINWAWNAEVYFGFDVTKDAEIVNEWHEESSGDVCLRMLGVDAKVEIVEKIKKIKKRLNVSFNDVVLGVIAASFTKFFKDNNKKLPKTIVTLNPYNLNASNFNDLVTFNANNEPVTNLGNNFTIGLISLPIKEGLLKDPREFIKEQHKITSFLKNSMDFQFMYHLVHNLITVTPLPVIIPMQTFYRPSTLVTNLPPLSKTNIIGHEIVDMTLSSVHVKSMSTCISVYSYRNVFHISTMVDKKCFDAKQQDAFSRDMLNFVDQIYNEL